MQINLVLTPLENLALNHADKLATDFEDSGNVAMYDEMHDLVGAIFASKGFFGSVLADLVMTEFASLHILPSIIVRDLFNTVS